MNEQTKKHVLNADIWIRLVYMLVFALLLVIARLVILSVAVLQFVITLFTGSDNQKLRELGQIAAKWAMQTFYFLTFNSEQKPFPFDDWPALDETAQPVTDAASLPEEPSADAKAAADSGQQQSEDAPEEKASKEGDSNTSDKT